MQKYQPPSNHQVFSIKRKNALSLKQENFIIFLSQGRPLGKNTVTDIFAFCSKIIKKNIRTLQDLSKQEAITIINALQRYEPRQSPLAPKWVKAKYSEVQDVRKQCKKTG